MASHAKEVLEAPGEPAAKRAKTEEESKEKEQDASADARAKLKALISFPAHYSTLNVLSTTGGRVLSSLSDAGAQYLVAGARADAAVGTGRYFYEVRVLEAFGSLSDQHQRKGAPAPRQLLRLGFSAAGSSLVLGDGEGAVCFDAEGFFLADGKRVGSSQRFSLSKDQVLAVLLNLDRSTPNAFTISLFRNGERLSEPQLLPAALQGKPLFPHVSYRNATLQVNCGPHPMKNLPFKCRMLQDAAENDVTVMKPSVVEDGKCEVVFPVGLPDEGTFHWLDGFLAEHPDYAELSDRKIVEWAAASGIHKRKDQSWKSSNDKPDFNFGILQLDDFSVRRILQSLVPLVPRNYVVMEVKQNLLGIDRKMNLKKFPAAQFRKVAHVVVGEPSEAYKEAARSAILKEKRTKAEEAWKAEKLDRERKKLIEQKQKDLQKERDRIEKERAAREAGAGELHVKIEKKEDEDVKMEDADEEKKEEAVEESAKHAEEHSNQDGEEASLDVQLTDEEKKLWFKPSGTSDLQPQVFTANFPQFSLPSKGEGFDDVRFEWQDAGKAQEYLEAWILKTKRTSRVDDLGPSEWLKTQIRDFQKKLSEWQGKQKEAATKERPQNDDIEDMGDLLSVQDVCNVGGEPLFVNFESEDWTLVNLRFELSTLLQAFRKDVPDEDREVTETHLPFYYERLYRKQLNPSSFGKENIRELLELVKDTICFDPETSVCFSALPQTYGTDGQLVDVSVYVKLTEERRRERQRRLDAGDETVRLKFIMRDLQQAHSTPAPPPPPPAPAVGFLPPPDPYKSDGYKSDSHKGYKSYGYKGGDKGKGKGYGKGKYY